MGRRPSDRPHRDRGLFRRGKRWYLRIYVGGQGRRVIALKPLGATRATTDKAVARVLARAVRQRLKGQAAPPARNLDELTEALVEAMGLTSSLSHSRRTQSLVRRFLRGQQILSVAEITPAKMENFLAAERAAGLAPATLQNHRAALSRFCEFLKTQSLLDWNPAREVATPKLDQPQPVWLSGDEIETALRLAKEHGISVEVSVALNTGLRAGELRQMSWADVSFSRRVLTVPKSKSHRLRAVPLNEAAMVSLREQQKKTGSGKYVFPGAGGGMRSRTRFWSAAIRPLQDAIPTFRKRKGQRVGRGWHVFRATFASRLAQRGVSLHKLASWLGHSNPAITARLYAHLSPSYDEDIEISGG